MVVLCTIKFLADTYENPTFAITKTMQKLILTMLLLSPLAASAQDTLSLRRNTVKLDITTRWLYRQAYVVSYERVVSPKQSWGVIVGFQQLPEARVLAPGVSLNRETRASGYKFGAEYRFYLAKENKYPAPHGVYLGPYVSFNSFRNEREITVDNGGSPEVANLHSEINVLNVGFQLGYQFVFNDRWTIDLSFMGPAVAKYNARLDLTGGTFDPDEIASDILEELINRFPALGEFISSGTATSNGRLDTWAAGFRYQVQVGYRFGKKK